MLAERQSDSSTTDPEAPRVVLRSRRMRLREFVYSDARDLLALDAQPQVTRHLLDHQIDTPTRALLLIQHLHALYAGDSGLGIWHASDAANRFLGYFSLMPVAPPETAAADAGAAEVEIGVRLHPAHWGKFYALEGGRALCAYAFDTLALPGLAGYCAPENRVIPLLLRRLGFETRGQTSHFGRPALKFALDADRWQHRARRS